MWQVDSNSSYHTCTVVAATEQATHKQYANRDDSQKTNEAEAAAAAAAVGR